MTRLLAGLLLGAWVLLEVLLRQGDEARSWQGGDADRSSTRLILVTCVVAFVAPILLDKSSAGYIHTGSVLAWIGIAIGATGLGIRIWSMKVLGTSYTRSLRTSNSQTIIDRGPYRLVRHPGYVGSILVWAGSRLAVNWLIAAATAVALVLVYVSRIRAEEAMLDDHF